MPYSKTTWKDRAVEHPRTYTMVDNGDGTITLVPAPGTVYEQGTPVNAANLNKIEQGIADATATAEAALPRSGGTLTGVVTANLGIDGASNWGTFSSNSSGNAMFAQNAYLHPTDGTFRYRKTHASLGARGIVFLWSVPAQAAVPHWFNTGSIATTADAVFTPTLIPLITSAGGQTINGKLSLGNLTGEKLYAYENGNTKAGFGFNMTEATNELAIFHSSPTGSQGRITFGKRLDDGTFVKYATFFSDGKLLVSEGTYGATARLQVGDGKYGLGAENSKLYLVSEFGEIRVANASGVDVGRVWDSSLLRNNNGLLELYYGGEWIPVSGAFIPFSERRWAGGQPVINQANTWTTLVNLNMRGRLERVNFTAVETGEGSGETFIATFRVTVDSKVVWQTTAQPTETTPETRYYLGGFNTDEQADYLYFNSNFKIEAQVNNVPSGGAYVRSEVFYRQAI